jgi:outer membrane immunogenic protein
MKLKWIGTGVAALALLTTSVAAQAADIPRPVYKGVRSVVAYYNWTGFYFGGTVGYGFGSSNWDLPPIGLSPKGMMYGLTLGYNYQTGSYVWGLEADYNWSRVKASSPCIILMTCETSSRWFGTLRGRVGYALDRFLPYVTAGVAFGDIRATLDPVGLTASKTNTGYAIGAGLEYALMGSWTAKFEYLYIDLGKFNTGWLAPIVTSNVSFKENIIRVGLNYKFSGPSF